MEYAIALILFPSRWPERCFPYSCQKQDSAESNATSYRGETESVSAAQVLHSGALSGFSSVLPRQREMALRFQQRA